MRNTFLILFISVFQAYSLDSYSQNTKLNLNMNQVPLASVLEKIEDSSEYLFLYNAKLVDVKREVSIIAENKEISDILSTLFSGTGVKFKVIDRRIVLSPSEMTSLSGSIQQQLKITGKVTDSSNSPLPGVTVVLKGTTQGAVTDSDGDYSVSNVPGDGTLVFSFVGMRTQEIFVAGKTIINVEMIEDAIGLEEVVAIGYGSMKKSDLTGSVVSVNEKDFNVGNVTNANQLIQGKTAGVTIFQSNAQPGGASSIQIRGATSVNASSQPLYVIDGMPIENSTLNDGGPNLSSQSVFTPAAPNPLNTINPADIESIEILKDASATAIYGSRGANGVVLITTKSGKSGKVEVSYDGSIAMQNIAKEYDTPSAYEYALGYNKVYDEYHRLRPDDPIFTNAVVKKFSSDEIAYYKDNGGTDWFNLLTRKGVINKHQISLSSGTEKSKIYASLGYMDHQGVIEQSDMQRLSSRLNLSQKFGEILEAAIRLNASTTKNTNIPVGSADVGFTRGGATSGVFSFAPTIEPYGENGEVAKHPFNQQHNNPVGLLLTDFNSESNRLITNAYLKADIAPGLFAKLSAGYDKVLDNSRTWVPAEAKNNLASTGEATVGSFTNETQTLNFIVQYNKNFKKHNIGIMAGTDYQAFEYHSLLGKSSGFKTSAYKYNSMQSGDVQKTITSKTTSAIFSYLSRINYSFDEKYLLTATFRYDGSSKFAEGNKWGFFPSVAFAWKLYNEPFIADLDVFSNLKLRASYGETGNQAIGNNNSQPLLGSRMEYVVGNTRGVPIGPVSPGNKDLSWETTKQTNVGLDFGFINNRISSSIDLYRMDTEDLLLWFGTPNTSGFGSILRNAGSIRNQGIEFSVTTQNTTRVVDWSTSFNVAYNQDRWLDRADLPFAPAEEFGPVRGIYGYEVVGMFKEGDDIANSAQPNSIPGQWIYKDVAGRDDEGNWINTPDGKINGDDRVLLGSSTPKVTAGFTNNVTYKNFTLTLFFQGMFGFDIWNQARVMHEDALRALNLEGLNKDAFNFYTPDNQDTDIPTPVVNPYGGSNNSKYLEDGDFVRLKTINLNYQLPIQSSWLKVANVYVNIDNALLWTKYEGLDPETARPIGTKSGSENDVYPNSRTYSLGLRMTF